MSFLLVMPLLVLASVSVAAFQPSKLHMRRTSMMRRIVMNEHRSEQESSPGLGAWTPIHSQDALRGLGPTKVKVMGVDFVVWEDKHSKQWSVMADICSHRFAPLSKGRVNTDTNCIECPYHGWQFGSDGALTCIPQMDMKSQDLSSSLIEKASVQSYPVHTTGDLIWAFLPSSMHGESFPQGLLPEDYYHNGLRRDMDAAANFAVVDVPASWDFFIENALDPAHFPFAHHGVISRREDSGPMPVEVNASNFTHFSVETSYVRKGEYRERIFGLQRPFNIFTLEMDKSGSGWRQGATFFFVPVEQGQARLITSIASTKLSRLPFLPNWMLHLLTLKLTEGDSIMYEVEQNARRSSTKCITPTTSDTGANAFRSWWKRYGLASAPRNTFGPASPEELKPRLFHEYTNPWVIHTKSCNECRRTLKRAKRMRKFGLSTGLFTALCFRVSGRNTLPVLLAAFLGLAVSSIGNEIALALEGSPYFGDRPDRSIPLD